MNSRFRPHLNNTAASKTATPAPANTMPRRARAQRSQRPYRSASASKPCSNAWNIRPCCFVTRRILAESMGVSVSATKPEITTEPATAMPNSLNSRPVLPCRNASGVNTATSAIVVAITAKAISRVPLIAAVSGSSPSSSWWR